MQRPDRTSIAIIACVAGILSIAMAACGGKKGDPSAPGDDPTVEGGVVDQGDQDRGIVGDTTIDAGPPPDATLPPAAVTFVLKNSGTEELALNLDRGWGSVIQVWSGKPPKATTVLPFATFCTASCDAVDEERCPVCAQPEKVTDIRAAQKLEKVAPGAELEVRWDAKVFTYEKTKGTHEGKNAKCSCYRPTDPPAETYSVRACGLRLTTTVGKTTQMVCAEGQITLPVSEPVRVELDYPDQPPPATPGKKKKR